jgi:hypothetical protein
MRGYATEGMDGNVYYTLGAKTRLDEILAARNTMPRRSAAEILLPKHGFTTAVWDRPRRPTVTELSGRVEIADGTFFSPGESQLDQTQPFESIGGIAGVAGLYRERGTLLVYTKAEHGHGFAICTKCGYAEPELRSTGAGRMDLPSRFENHYALDRNAKQKNAVCWTGEEATVLRHQWLAALQTTDVLLLDLSGACNAADCDRTVAATLGHALRLGAARLLELDSRELGSTSVTHNQQPAILLYENSPGGAGHLFQVLRTSEAQKEWLQVTLRDVLFVNESHHAQCETACLDCLLTFDTQGEVASGSIHRRRAHALLTTLMSRQ